MLTGKEVVSKCDIGEMPVATSQIAYGQRPIEAADEK